MHQRRSQGGRRRACSRQEGHHIRRGERYHPSSCHLTACPACHPRRKSDGHHKRMGGHRSHICGGQGSCRRRSCCPCRHNMGGHRGMGDHIRKDVHSHSRSVYRGSCPPHLRPCCLACRRSSSRICSVCRGRRSGGGQGSCPHRHLQPCCHPSKLGGHRRRKGGHIRKDVQSHSRSVCKGSCPPHLRPYCF